MANASILFSVPEELGDLPAILDRHYAVCPDAEGLEDEDALREHLAGAKPGSVVNFDFEDAADPLGVIIDLSKALASLDARFWAHSDAFVERSRGIRMDGRILLRLGGETQEFELRWSDGDPAFDERTLRAAGASEETVAAAIAWAFSPSADNASEPPKP